MIFAKNIEKVRKYFNTSNAGLEKILDLSNGYISGIEKNGTDNPGKLLLALKAKGISTDWFLSGEGEMLLSSVPAKTGEGQKVPLLRQKVSCGRGMEWETEDNIQEYIDIFDLVPRLKAGRVFALSVQGNSMIGAGIRSGDYVLFDSEGNQALSDGIYVFSLDGDVFCKQLEFDAISKKIKIYSIRVADMEKADLLLTLNAEDADFADRFRIFGHVFSWFHPNLEN